MSDAGDHDHEVDVEDMDELLFAAPEPGRTTPFDHVVVGVLNSPRDSPLYEALVVNGWDDVECFRGFREEDIVTLCTSTRRASSPLSDGLKGKFRQWIRFVKS